MLTTAGEIFAFDIVQRPPGVVLLWPSRENPEKLNKYQANRKLFAEGYKYERWGDFLGVNHIANLNEMVQSSAINDLIIIAEDRHQYFINMVADEIAASRKDVKIILMSGPTSAGKTTTSKRLRNQLIVRGVRPHTIEMDNYFFSRTETPLGEDGKPDFESISAVDVMLFNDHLEQLSVGEEVQMPLYNFVTGQREAGEILKIGEDDILIVEGIHGLNEALTRRIPKNKKYKVYLNALTQLNIDQHNYIPTSDTRLIRRIVRDSRVRGNSAESTMTMWEKIKKGEESNIFPYQEEADFIINTSLFYEFSVLKRYALPLLEKVERQSCCYSEAQRLIELLSYFVPIENERAILTNSVIREFIGGSIYDDEE
jgi:uridine kinase